MCLVPRLNEFEDQDQRSKVKVTRGKRNVSALSAACMPFMFGKTSLASSFHCCIETEKLLKSHRQSCTYTVKVTTYISEMVRDRDIVITDQ